MALQVGPSQTTFQFNRRYLRIKRAIDIFFCLMILLPLCLLTGVLALLIRLDSQGPIFYRQKRVGQHGKEFWMYKFRSMYIGSDDALHRAAIERYMSGQALNNRTDRISYKQTNDPRVTRVGRFIRRTSIDELPQFFNVLRGEMTLVGPRPPLPYEVERYTPDDYLRLCGKPGLTGPWQVYGRSRVSFQEMVRMDSAYLQRQSIVEDLKLILLTIPVMLLGSGGA
jgi:lipopolysaccharide/colanic/teichoic acid biosynthesis glycosyltransferase